MIQVTGILKTPTNQVSGKTLIRITSLDSSGDCLSFLKSFIYTGQDGAYDFQLVDGRYSIEVCFCNKYWLTGSVFVNSTTLTPIDLPTLLQEYSTSGDRPTPRGQTHTIYAGFSPTNRIDVIDPYISKGTSIVVTSLHGSTVTLHKLQDTPEYMWVWVPDVLGNIQGFNFGADFVQPWLSKVATVDGIGGKIYISDNATHAKEVNFKIIT